MIEALKLALDALETELSIDWTNNDEFNASAEKMHKAIAAIKEALTQPEQEPVVCCQQYDTCLQPCTPRGEHLAQRTWVGLTNEEAMDVTRKEGHELLDFIYEYGTGSEGVEERIVAICKAIEVRLKQNNGYSEEKNT
jgi:hypothetical protein